MFASHIPEDIYKPKLPIQHQNRNPLKSTFQSRRKGHEELVMSLIMKATFLEQNRLGTSFRDWQDHQVNIFSYRKYVIGF